MEGSKLDIDPLKEWTRTKKPLLIHDNQNFSFSFPKKNPEGALCVNPTLTTPYRVFTVRLKINDKRKILN